MSLLNRLRGKNDEPRPPEADAGPSARAGPTASAEPTVEGVREAIRKNVYDPELGFNIVDLGLVYDIQVVGGKHVDIKMTLTSPGCPIGPQLIGGVQTYVNRAYPDLDAINVHVVWTPMWNPDMISQEAKDQLGFF
ncbi:MAG: metal-sulfur cluster assembly factor [Chloroflexi bacterium]|nr:metal-sulfur cluster assembly factor [Chloroflexota bacterium]